MSLELPTLGTDTNTHLNKICSTCIYIPSTERSIKTGSLTAYEHLRPLFASHEQGLSRSQLFMRVTSLTRRRPCQRPCAGIALTTPQLASHCDTASLGAQKSACSIFSRLLAFPVPRWCLR